MLEKFQLKLIQKMFFCTLIITFLIQKQQIYIPFVQRNVLDTLLLKLEDNILRRKVPHFLYYFLEYI